MMHPRSHAPEPGVDRPEMAPRLISASQLFVVDGMNACALPGRDAPPVMTIAPEFTVGEPGGFPDVRLYRRTCETAHAERCVAACPGGSIAISGGHDPSTRTRGPAYRVDGASWGVTLSGDAAGAVTVWVMCL